MFCVEEWNSKFNFHAAKINDRNTRSCQTRERNLVLHLYESLLERGSTLKNFSHVFSFLTYFWPMFVFHFPLKYHKTRVFLIFSGRKEIAKGRVRGVHRAEMDQYVWFYSICQFQRL